MIPPKKKKHLCDKNIFELLIVCRSKSSKWDFPYLDRTRNLEATLRYTLFLFIRTSKSWPSLVVLKFLRTI